VVAVCVHLWPWYALGGYGTVLALLDSYPRPIHSLPQLTHYTDASGTDLFGEGLWEQRAHYTARRAKIREALAPYVAPEAYALDSYEADEGDGESEESGKTFPTLPKPKHQPMRQGIGMP
jgi:hypothetical protein